MSAIDSYDEAYDMVNRITAKLQDEDDFHPTEWSCSKCHFVNNDDESYCQKNIFGGNRCSTPRFTAIIPWGSAFRGKAQQAAANNEPRVSGSSNKSVCESTAGTSGLAEKKKKKYKKYPINTIDGVKIEFDKDWVHLRRSNTEPIIRVYAEAPTKTAADDLASRILRELAEVAEGQAMAR